MASFAASDVFWIAAESREGEHVYEIDLGDGAAGRVHSPDFLPSKLVAAALSYQMRLDSPADAAYRLRIPQPLWLEDIIAPPPLEF